MNASRAAWGLAAVLTVGLALFANSHGWREDSRASAGSHSVTLHWLPATVATSYNVYRGTVSGGPYVNIGTTATTTYVDNALPGSGVFYYVVTSVGNHSESGFSQEIKVTVP